MAESRQVVVHLDATQQTQIREVAGADAFNRAIGYLSTWNMSFPVVEIYADRELPDLVAHFYRLDTSNQQVHAYTIGAVWHDDHYGFHS